MKQYTTKELAEEIVKRESGNPIRNRLVEVMKYIDANQNSVTDVDVYSHGLDRLVEYTITIEY